MFKGFYTATSGMLSQSRILNTISNNMSNASTPGYKRDVLATTTFKDEMVIRTGNLDKKKSTKIGTSSMIRTAQELVTDYEEGLLEFTDRPLDFNIQGKGFFQIKTPEGEYRYTRNGSFNLDADGYLVLQHVGRVIGEDGDIFLGTEKISLDNEGNIRHKETGETLGSFQLADFNNYKDLIKTDEGMFEVKNPLLAYRSDAELQQGALERSNVEAAEEMVSMIAGQRAFQSSAQIAKAYDEIMGKAVEIGRL